MESLVVTDAVSKTYGPRTVVDGVHLSVRAGEVHALVGENGAGKSTLANMIAGVVRPSSGSVRVDGRPLGGGGPRAARRAGVAFVSQELSLLGERTVVENVFTGQMPTRVPGIVSRSRMRTAFAALMQDTGLRLDPDRRVDGLNAVEQEFVEILRAVAAGAHLIILDEPTTATTPDQAELIYRLVGRLAERGVAIVL
ncbi:MAG: sugar ABC transporter ATP-binding protein, partial [Mesorhizobium sp.]|nr:sugar ABC transporter ATP-binding protein [Mesorhizobium sp.]